MEDREQIRGAKPQQSEEAQDTQSQPLDAPTEQGREGGTEPAGQPERSSGD